MRKMKNYNVCLLSLICFFICSCDYVKLPPLEQSPCPYKTGERFFCEIDGKPFRPNNDGFLFTPSIDTKYFKDNNSNDDVKQRFRFSFNVQDKRNDANVSKIFLEFLIPLNTSTPAKILLEKNQIASGLNKVDSEDKFIPMEYKILEGEIIISKIDTSTSRISGKFNFYCYEAKNSRIISKVKNGYFNDLYYPHKKFNLQTNE